MNYSIKVDYVGMMAGILCLIHCIATPFIFIAKSCAVSCCADTPVWWHAIDYVFLVISFLAIYHSTKNTQKAWVKIGLWFNWVALLCIILNEQFVWFYLPKETIYIPSVLIVFLHLYNHKYCKCAEDHCCAKSLNS